MARKFRSYGKVYITKPIVSLNTTTTKTITGLARIQATTTQTITGKARIQITSTQTITGKSRIQITSPKTITGTARITAKSTQTITGKARIQATTTQTISGKARIQISSSQTITGKSRIQISTPKTTTGKGKITTTELLDQRNYIGTTGIGFGDTGNGRDYMCQGFIPTGNTVTSVSFQINSKDGSSDVGYLVWIDNVDSSSNPLGTVNVGIGGATEITNAQLIVGNMGKYVLSAPVTVVPGQRYGIVVVPWNTTTHAKVSSYNDWQSSTANPYASGRRVHLDGSFANPSAPDAGNDDILFETYSAIPASQVISGKSRIQATTLKNITGVANIAGGAAATKVRRTLMRVGI